jgi:membrane-bound serine protease (ClpP class)
MLFEMPDVSDLSVSFWSVLVPIVVAFGIIGGLVVFAVSQSSLRAQSAGVEELVGLVGKAVEDLAPEGRIFVRGEHWNATADETIESGQPVQITAVEGLRLRVRRPQSGG